MPKNARDKPMFKVGLCKQEKKYTKMLRLTRVQSQPGLM